MIPNLKHAVRNRETVTIGGGDFTPDEIKTFINAHEDLTDLLYAALPYVENALDDPAYKPEPVRKLINQIRATLERAEQ